MPAFKFPSPILYLASEPSFFAILDGDNKNLNLKDVTRIDFPLVEKGVINKENLTHALKSLEQKSVHLVASDEIFYHHISDYALGAKKNIEEEIKETVSTVFADKKEPLHIVTVDLAKTSKMQTVQITAMTKANLSTLAEAAEEAGVEIEAILPASFVVKAFVSVDPSLFLLVTPQSYLLTSHYIGVDFAQNLAKDDTKELIETVKTLKKERPHIQHIYICADRDTVTSLNEELSEVLPIQDVEVKEMKSENDTPFFLKALTLGVKEVVDNDFPLPHFSVKNAEPRIEKESTKESIAQVSEKETVEPIAEVLKEVQADEEKKVKLAEKVVDETEPEEEEIPVPTKITKKVEEKEVETIEKEVKVEKAVDTEEESVSIPAPTVITAPKVVAPAVAPEVAAAPKIVVAPSSSTTSVVTKTIESKTIETPAKVIAAPTPVATVAASASTTSAKPAKKMSMFKYIMLALCVALVISLIGGGVVISQQALSEKNAPLQTPISSVSPTQKPSEPTPTPAPTAAPVDLKKLNVLVLNATSIAGKAGKTATAVKKAGAKTVDAGNAKDKYETGTFIMLAKPELEGAKSTLEKATELSFDEMDMSKKENPDGKYDIVIILNE